MSVVIRTLLSLEKTRRTIVPNGDATIAAFEYGNPDGVPVVLIHGWSHSHLCWFRQLSDERLTTRSRMIAIDLRGHGDSSDGGGAVMSSAAQAGDVRAVLEWFDVDGALMVGWSLGGVVLCDYLARHGLDRLAGAIFVGTPVDIDPGSEANDAGPALAAALPGMTGIDLVTGMVEEPSAADNIVATMDFADACGAVGLERPDAEALLAVSMMVTPASRRAILDRPTDDGEVPMLSALAKARVQGLRAIVLYGGTDRVCNPRGSERLARALGVVPKRYEDAGHAVMIDQAARFADDLIGMVELIEADQR